MYLILLSADINSAFICPDNTGTGLVCQRADCNNYSYDKCRLNPNSTGTGSVNSWATLNPLTFNFMDTAGNSIFSSIINFNNSSAKINLLSNAGVISNIVIQVDFTPATANSPNMYLVTIAYKTVTFVNNTPYSVNIAIADSGAFINPTGPQLDWNSFANVWQISARTTSAGILGDILNYGNIHFQIAGSDLFWIDLNNIQAGVTNIANSGFKATSASDGIGGSIITISLAPTITLVNNTTYYIFTLGIDSSAFVNPTLSLAWQTSTWMLPFNEKAVATIGNVSTNTAVAFQAWDETIFTLDFTQSPIAVHNISNSGFIATATAETSYATTITIVPVTAN